jgi:UDP-N-acetylglucosamine--N-acetylmuramyl-(pentapeptide) pyrophosphoryl-undecaprenol N-acetylglucosamine transferase
MMRIVLTGGGTGGHIFPLVSVAKKIREKVGNVDLLYLGANDELERQVMAESGIRTKYVMSGKIRRYFSLANIGDFFKIPFGIIQALWYLLWYMPDAVFSKGGYVAVPVSFAAWVYSIPILTHESDSIPGLANRMIGAMSDRVAISYPRTRRYFSEKKVFLTGNPVRDDINRGSKGEFLKKYSLTESRPIILVLGGSQGAKNINIAITSILGEIVKLGQVLHQTGKANYEETIKMARVSGIKENRDGYYPIAFIMPSEMKDFLAAADVIISRAGANSISEIAANGKSSILIPLPGAANNHQGMNAYYLAENGGAIVLEESNLGRSMLIQKIESILNDKELKDKLSRNIKEFYHVDAADKIAQGIIDLV